MAIKGQNLRIFVGGKVVAAATTCNVEINAQTEQSTTKDSDGDWDENEVVGKSWTFSTDSLVVSDDAAAVTSVGAIALIGTTVAVEFAMANGTKNRTKGTALVSGSAIINKVSFTAQNRQNGTCSISAVGTGPIQ